MRLRIVPVTLDEANRLIKAWHRHHVPAVGARWSIGVIDGTGLCHGAAVAGRPVARLTDQRMVCEVTRCVTDGTPNACSALYGAAARIAKGMGFALIQTFILDEETGVSLRAAGWEYDGPSMGGDWNRPNLLLNGRAANRTDQPLGAKGRWVKRLAEPLVVRFPVLDDDELTLFASVGDSVRISGVSE